MATKFTESTPGKIIIVIVAIAAVATAVFVGIKVSSGNDSPHASDAEVKADAQKQIDALKSNTTLPPDVKAEMIAHQEGLLRGGGQGARTAPPGSTSPGG